MLGLLALYVASSVSWLLNQRMKCILGVCFLWHKPLHLFDVSSMCNSASRVFFF